MVHSTDCERRCQSCARSLALYMLAGLVMALASAWWCALLVYLDDQRRFSASGLEAVNSCNGAQRVFTDEDAYPRSILTATPAAEAPRMLHRKIITRITDRRGWPWPCLEMELWEGLWKTPTDMIIESDFDLVIDPGPGCVSIGLSGADQIRSDFWARDVFQREFLLLPVSPVWPGLLASTLFYAMVVHAFTRMWVVGRALRARPADRCRQCGYLLTGNMSGVCSECGLPHLTP